MKIVVLFNLKPGADVSAYEAWARSVDVPTVRSLPSVGDFNVYRTVGLFGSGELAPYQYVEIIEARDEEAFATDAAGEKVSALAEQFMRFADDPKFVVVEEL